MYNVLVKQGIFALICLSLLTVPAAALPGEAAAVVRRCGPPTARNQSTSPVTGRVQHDLYYGNTILHFEPVESGWSFTSAWQGNLPISKRALEAEMPCFRDALAEVAAAPRQVIDPTIARQIVVPPVSSGNSFGVQFFWLIVGLTVVLILLIALPTARKPARKPIGPGDRPYRKPDLSKHDGIHIADPDRLDR